MDREPHPGEVPRRQPEIGPLRPDRPSAIADAARAGRLAPPRAERPQDTTEALYEAQSAGGRCLAALRLAYGEAHHAAAEANAREDALAAGTWAAYATDIRDLLDAARRAELAPELPSGDQDA